MREQEGPHLIVCVCVCVNLGLSDELNLLTHSVCFVLVLGLFPLFGLPPQPVYTDGIHAHTYAHTRICTTVELLLFRLDGLFMNSVYPLANKSTPVKRSITAAPRRHISSQASREYRVITPIYTHNPTGETC